MYSQKYLESLSLNLSETEVSIDGLKVPLEQGINDTVALLRQTQSMNAMQLFLGNGASAAFAEHMALDWTKNGGVRSMSPSSWVLMTALSNDVSFEDVFATVVDRYASENDVVVTVSSSGNSRNIIAAIAQARRTGCKVITMSGLKPDNESRSNGDINFYVPARTYGMVECAHQVLLHMILDAFMDVKEWDRTSYQDMNASTFQL